MKQASAALEGQYRFSHRVYELAGMAATSLSGLWLATRLYQLGAVRLVWVPIAMALGMIGADLVSGMVHWAFDTWGSVDTPVVGKLAIRTFRQHHIDPAAMLHHDFIETNGHNFALALTLTTSGLYLVRNHPSNTALFAALSLFSMALFVAFTSQIHKWAHMVKPPGIVRVLQGARVLLHPAHHHRHHVAPHQHNYCITVGWLDGVLARIYFFPVVEAVIEVVTGVKPRKHP
jgi:hypothetical protein